MWPGRGRRFAGEWGKLGRGVEDVFRDAEGYGRRRRVCGKRGSKLINC